MTERAKRANPPSRSKKPAITWGEVIQHVGELERDGYRFWTVYHWLPADRVWQSGGFVTPAEATELDQVLAQHHHQVLGVNFSPERAKKRCEKWLRTAPVPATLCECSNLEAAHGGSE